MMSTFTEYQIIEQIYQSANSLAYRARREIDNQLVILKTLKGAYPSPERIAWFKREYQVTRNLNPSTPSAGQVPSASSGQGVPGVIVAYGLEYIQQQRVMVLEDFGNHSSRGVPEIRMYWTVPC